MENGDAAAGRPARQCRGIRLYDHHVRLKRGVWQCPVIPWHNNDDGQSSMHSHLNPCFTFRGVLAMPRHNPAGSALPVMPLALAKTAPDTPLAHGKNGGTHAHSNSTRVPAPCNS